MNIKLLEERSQVLHHIITTTSEHYFSPTLNEGQRGLYQTILGATLWYLPGSTLLFSGKISKAALKSLEENPDTTKLVGEHSFPRKIGGKYLYEILREKGSLSLSDIMEIYMTKLGRYNLVLKTENDKLKKWQKLENFKYDPQNFLKDISFIEEYAYENAQIELTAFSTEQYKAYMKRKAKKTKKDNSQIFPN